MTTQSTATTVNMTAQSQSAERGGMRPVTDKRKAAIHKTAVEFQSLFVEMMLKSMRETVGQDKLTGGGHGEEVYSSFLDHEYASAISRRGGFGLAEAIEKQMLSRETGSGKGTSGGAGISSNEKTAKSEKIEVSHENQ